jgi:hypothetical protein
MSAHRRGRQTATDEDRPHRGRRNGDAKGLQFADDPSVAPARVLACESKNKRSYPTIERRPSRSPVRVRPSPPNQLAVPAQQPSPDSPRGLPRHSAVAPARAPPGLPDPRDETALAAAADAGSPAHVGARGSRVPSSAPICTGARPAEPDGRAPDRRTTRPRQPPESGKAEAIDLRAEPALRARTEFLNPTRSRS